jgi:hypothetical protein
MPSTPDARGYQLRHVALCHEAGCLLMILGPQVVWHVRGRRPLHGRPHLACAGWHAGATPQPRRRTILSSPESHVASRREFKSESTRWRAQGVGYHSFKPFFHGVTMTRVTPTNIKEQVFK